MSSGNVSSGSPPKDIEWRPIGLPIPLEISLLGKDAVEAQRDIPGLKFVAVEAAWTMILPARHGKLYAIINRATPADGIPGDYLAIVHANLMGNFEQLVSFADYSLAH